MSYITTKPHDGPVRIIWRGHVIAASHNAIDLKEGSGRPVLYVPRQDADMAYFAKTTRRSHCPHKGDASYFSLHDGATSANDVVWTYEDPLDAVRAIAGHLAFYPNHVTVEMTC